jgi:hypothetical protein
MFDLTAPAPNFYNASPDYAAGRTGQSETAGRSLIQIRLLQSVIPFWYIGNSALGRFVIIDNPIENTCRSVTFVWS